MTSALRLDSSALDLDDSFLPTLTTLLQVSGEEIALTEMQVNVNQQRCIVQELRQELAIASQRGGSSPGPDVPLGEGGNRTECLDGNLH